MVFGRYFNVDLRGGVWGAGPPRIRLGVRGGILEGRSKINIYICIYRYIFIYIYIYVLTKLHTYVYRFLYILDRTYGRILDFELLGIEQKTVTKWHSNRSPGLILDDSCSVCRAGAVRNGPGPNFGLKPAKYRPNQQIYFSALI